MSASPIRRIARKLKADAERDAVIADLSALKLHPEYWAMPQVVHLLIDRAREVADGQ